MTLSARALTVRYRGASRDTLNAIDVDAPNARTLCIVGPSGAGKTTLLRALCGLIAYEGNVLFETRSVDASTPQDRGFAFVAAADTLFETRSVAKNLAFARPTPSREAVADIAHRMGIADLIVRYPKTLSSGERQRVALARALLARPRALLLDEPLAALDPVLRTSVRAAFLNVRMLFDGPMIVVTHDHAEAMTLGDSVAVLIEGRIEDVGDPQRVYDRPRSVRSALFFGTRPMNVIDRSEHVLVGIRPERIEIVADGLLEGVIDAVERTGADMYVSVVTARGTIVARTRESLHKGQRVGLGWNDRDAVTFDKATGLGA